MRTARVVIPGCPHHVIHRGNNRRRLFSRRNDYLRFVDYLGKAFDQVPCSMQALTVMPNHVHLLVTPPERKRALGDFVKAFAQRYSRHRNRERSATGKLYEERYWSHPVLDEKYLAIVTAYIELNPVRAGLAKHPGDYPWSTYWLHAGQPERSLIPSGFWTPSPWYIGLGATPELRAIAYVEWADYCRTRELRPPTADCVDTLETESEVPYALRLLRPDESRASEPAALYGTAEKRR